MVNQDNTSQVRTTEKTFEILDAIVKLEGARLSEITEYLDISPSTAHRHLRTLEEYGYITKYDGKFQIGFKFLMMGGIARNSRPEYKLAEDYVKKLSEKTKERAQFVIEENGERVFVFRRVGENAVRGDANIGKRGPLHCSAAGKALLAEFSDQRVREIVNQHGLPAETDQTITNIDKLFEELANIQDQGYAVNREESAKGFHAIAVSVKSPNGSVIGALSISGPAHRLNKDKIKHQISDLVRGMAQELELKIEYS